MNRPRLVVIGNGMAGVRTLEELLALAPQLYDITVFGAEPHPNYNRILLSPVLAGEQGFNDIVLNDLDWYRHHASTCAWAGVSSGSTAHGAASSPTMAAKPLTTGC